MAVVGGVRVLLHDLFKDMPAWVVSLLFHLLLLTLLGLWTYENPQEEPFITLSSDVSRVNTGIGHQGEFVIEAKNEQHRQVLLVAKQEAREIRLDPDAPAPQLPDLSRVKETIRSHDPQQRMLAARDPRVRLEMVEQEGGTLLTEAAVARGLRWLSQQQNEDGGWGLKGRGRSDAAGTSLALLPFLGAGQTHQTGRYSDEVSKGLRWLIDKQKPDGDLRAGTPSQHGMYAHGQATIVLCEAFKMTGDERFRLPAQKAVDFILKAQHAEGGWRYRPGEPGDTSVVGWQLMALQSARVAHLTVPETRLELAGQFLDSVQHEDGAKYSYQRGRGPTETMTAEGLLCRMYLGWNKRDNPAMVDGVNYLASHHLPDHRKVNVYYWYYATQVMHHFGGPQWQKWNLRMREALVRLQETGGQNAGSWAPAGPHGGAGGRLYMTSLSTCTLEVYYRHAPIFRQIKLD